MVHVERRQRTTRHHHHHHHHHDGDDATTDGGGPSGSDQVESDEEYARRLQVCNVFSTYMLWHMVVKDLLLYVCMCACTCIFVCEYQ